MNALHRPFTPTKNRRFNELIGFSMIAAALLLFLAFASYSPFDPSLNTASVSEGSPTHNWIGRVGAVIADLSLQALGIAVFALPVMLGMLGLRWFRSRHIHSPIEKLLGALTLLLFIPAFMGLLPGHLRWMHALAIEGVSGKL
ncbi:MAG: cell division protein FtsK, partial [Acidobacteria bacterium]